MAQTVLITLTTAGTDTGPFDLYSDADGYTTPFEVGVSKTSLVAGYTSTMVPDAATIIRVQSTITCLNYVDLTIVTTTTTTTTAAVLLRTFRVNNTGGSGFTMNVSVDSVQIYAPTLIASGGVTTYTPDYDVYGKSSSFVDYTIYSAPFTPSSANLSFSIYNYSATINTSGSDVTLSFTGVQLDQSINDVDLTINP